ncbi:Tryptophanyl-tRNA synthetase,mitochondrial [Taphrina deformans PYCC 5710]|uniref:Tryptophan--tRNA ligase, mitochondrial n=1 Tax=Taphrina deformans (strain PYCC 5710 / ATCC 11124 / CBS 356.35 / IMI 108563 / JCM 9778 / NBRC 8474) TaxID=1097556 RepID=R4XC21_TAPDE|nr:Tryptophanyl-tRNA synthetase,mitochondrial [Taphrina deformans PYCC 5710]|eukprot:CCG83366.1 Tryptophanyl-tRNA synthetase,mitochondrial [Taphrina deformans PYCC 5710]
MGGLVKRCIALHSQIAKRTLSTSPITSELKSEKSRVNARDTQKVRPRTIFSGIQPTGIPHIGNYLGALKNWVELQDTANDQDTIIFSIVDLHAITVSQNASALRQAKREMLASLLALGIKPGRSILYEQSSVMEHTELSWILSTIAPLGALNRMTQFKSKARLITNRSDNDSLGGEESIDGLMLGLFAYPVLQAADILLYKTTLVPVGEDQSQHLELSRTLAKGINSKMGSKIFPLPETLLSKSAARVSDLRDPTKKMSKSAVNEKSRISILDQENVIRKKINTAMTDSLLGITYDQTTRPGIVNLLDIYAAFAGRSDDMQNILREVKDFSHKALKEFVADQVVASLEPIRQRYLALDIESTVGKQRLEDISKLGAEKAKVIAQRTMNEVRGKMGLR